LQGAPAASGRLQPLRHAAQQAELARDAHPDPPARLTRRPSNTRPAARCCSPSVCAISSSSTGSTSSSVPASPP
ncbi:MAG: hypothetical protein ACK56I_30360, partial [bacterium]